MKVVWPGAVVFVVPPVRLRGRNYVVPVDYWGLDVVWLPNGLNIAPVIPDAFG